MSEDEDNVRTNSCGDSGITREPLISVKPVVLCVLCAQTYLPLKFCHFSRLNSCSNGWKEQCWPKRVVSGEWQLQALGHEVTSRGYFQGIIRHHCHGQQELNPALPGHSSLHAPSTAHSPGAIRKFDIDHGKVVSAAYRHLGTADMMKPVKAA